MQGAYERAKSLVGLCMRAGQCRCGGQAVETAVRRGEAQLVVLDTACAANAQKKYMNLCKHYSVPLLHMPDVCAAAGRPDSICIAIQDKGFAQRIKEEIESHQCGG